MSLSGKLLITACFDHFIRCYDTEVYSQYVYIIMCILRMYDYYSSQTLTLLQMYGKVPDLPFTLCSANEAVSITIIQ